MATKYLRGMTLVNRHKHVNYSSIDSFTKNGANLWAGTRRNERPILVSAESSKCNPINISINTTLYVKHTNLI